MPVSDAKAEAGQNPPLAGGGSDAHLSLDLPHLPWDAPATSICGRGSATSKEVAAGCARPPQLWGPAPEARCDLVTTEGASWETRCDGQGLVRTLVRLSSVRTAKQGCFLHPAGTIELTATGPTASGSTADTAVADVLTGASQTSIELDFASKHAAPSGKGIAWLVGRVQCMRNGQPAEQGQAIVAGIEVSWALPAD